MLSNAYKFATPVLLYKTVVQSVILIVKQEPILLSNDFYQLTLLLKLHFETNVL